MKSFVLPATAALLLWGSSLSAQEPLPDGARVRIMQKQQGRWIGTLRSMSRDSVTVADTVGRVYVLPRQDISLERSRGPGTRFWKHFGLSMAAAGALGGLISAATWSECDDCWIYPQSRVEAFGWGFLAGGAIGVPIGVIVGAAVKVERWELVPLEFPGTEAHVPHAGARRFALSVSLPLR